MSEEHLTSWERAKAHEGSDVEVELGIPVHGRMGVAAFISLRVLVKGSAPRLDKPDWQMSRWQIEDDRTAAIARVQKLLQRLLDEEGPP